MRVTLAVGAAVALAAIGAWNPVDDPGTVTAQASHSPWGAPTQGETQTVLDGVYTLDQARRGEQIYKEQCTLCHRDNLLGNTIDGGPPLRGPQFTTRWQDLSIETLLVTIEELMPMSEPGSLSRQEYVDAVSFILWANELPAGKTELPSVSET